MPTFSAPATWTDVETIFHLDREISLQRMPRVTSGHIYDLIKIWNQNEGEICITSAITIYLINTDYNILNKVLCEM